MGLDPSWPALPNGVGNKQSRHCMIMTFSTHEIPTSLSATIYSHNILDYIINAIIACTISLIILHKCYNLPAQYPLLYNINALIILENTSIYIHDIHILWKNTLIRHIKTWRNQDQRSKPMKAYKYMTTQREYAQLASLHYIHYIHSIWCSY